MLVRRQANVRQGHLRDLMARVEGARRFRPGDPLSPGRCADEVMLEEQAKALVAKLASRQESVLLSPPAAREAAWALVAKWLAEMDQVRQRLAMLQTA